jgi:N-acetylglucosaminyldiphosphoundecaprenol N-acetyl-beta-D-mannosaminyltransferase
MDKPVPLPPSMSVLGVRVSPFDSYPHALACIEERIRSRQKTFCVAINPEKVYRAMHDPDLRALLASTDIGICDGIGVALAARLLYGKSLPRCTGVDLFLELAGLAAKAGFKVFLLGAAPEVNQAAAERLTERYPGIRIAGRQDGYFKDTAAVVSAINASGADMLFVAMGSPRQEFWIREHRDALNVPFCMGVGGSLDVMSGRVQRAPRFFRRTGTEFLYRLIKEPWRLRRQLVLPLFLLHVLASKFKAHRGTN